MSKPDYDTTIARVAGNILSGTTLQYLVDDYEREEAKRLAVVFAVEMARAVIAEVKRTEPLAALREASRLASPPAPTKVAEFDAVELDELRSIRNELWNKTRSPEGKEERLRYSLANRVDTLVRVTSHRLAAIRHAKDEAADLAASPPETKSR